MQSCPKNVHIGPLTGECKRPGALPLPPVALQLPQEPPGAAGPPSPARGSAGMPPLPSPVSNSARPNCGPPWDGRQTKPVATDSYPDIKWDEPKTKVEVKSKCKSEIIYADNKVTWSAADLTKTKYVTTVKKSELTSRKWEVSSEDAKEKSVPECFTQVQGLLAISSTEFSKVPAWTQDGEANAIESKNIKVEKSSSSTEKSEKGTVIQPPKKRKSIGEETQKNRKRRKAEEGDEEEELSTVISDELLKKNKRKLVPSDENTDKKVRKVKKKLTVNQKDENEFENATGNTKKSQKSVILPKPKLLKDRNGTVACDTVSEVIEEVIKGQTNRKKKRTDEEEVVSNKILNRRKSNQEKWSVPFAEAHYPRKSKSCSPSRSTARRESSPARSLREDGKRKVNELKGLRNGKGKVESKSKSLEKIPMDHSKNSKLNKKHSGGGIVSKAKIGVGLLGRNAQYGCSASGVKSKKSSSLSVANVKKSAVTKALATCPKSGISPKWSNGWFWDSESFDAKVYLTVRVPSNLQYAINLTQQNILKVL